MQIPFSKKPFSIASNASHSSNATTSGLDRDLDTTEAIEQMVEAFYAKVAVDDLLGPVFNDVAHVDWNLHVPKIARFWNRILLEQPGYEGNPLRSHEHVNAKTPMTQQHFDRWLSLFRDTIAATWSGPKATRAIAFAENVARGHYKYLHDRTEPQA